MAYDMTFKVGLEPEVDERALYKSIMKVTGAIRKAKPGTSHVNLSKQFGGLLQDLMATGRFATPSQAEQYVRRISGGKYTQEQMGIFTGGTSMVRANMRGFVPALYPTFSQRQMAQWKPDLSRLGSQYNTLLDAYKTAKLSPTEENKSALIQAVKDIDASVNEIKKDRGKTLKTVDKIQKTSKDIGREAANIKPLTPTNTSTALGAVGYLQNGLKGLLRMFGWGSIAAVAKKWVDLSLSGIKEGQRDLIEQAMYGSNRNIAIGRSRAKIYGLDESVTAAPERYALDFRQRMMWGEVSDMEWVALSRMGSLGRKIISGEAAANPAAFQKDIENYIRANKGNEAEVRFMLGKLGWPPQIMGYGAGGLTEKETAELDKAYAENIKMQKDAAVLIWASAIEYKKIIDQLRAGSSSGLAGFVDSPAGRTRQAQMWGMAGYSEAERNAVIADAMKGPQTSRHPMVEMASKYTDIASKLGILPSSYNKVFDLISATPTAPNIYINNMNVNGDNAESVSKDIQSKAAPWMDNVSQGGN